MPSPRLSFGLIGGVASAAYGRPRWTKDIDVFCRADDAETVLELLAARSFEVERTNPMWIYKAFRDDVQIDVIFKVRWEVYFDQDDGRADPPDGGRWRGDPRSSPRRTSS